MFTCLWLAGYRHTDNAQWHSIWNPRQLRVAFCSAKAANRSETFAERKATLFKLSAIGITPATKPAFLDGPWDSFAIPDQHRHAVMGTLRPHSKYSKAAKNALLETYRVATAKLAASGRVDELQEIQQKIRDRGLVSKLVSLQLTSRPSLHLIHADYKCIVQDVPRHQRLNATFEMVIGLSTDGIVRESIAQSGIQGRPSEIVSFRAVNAPNNYLAHGNNELLLQPYIDDNAFRQNSSFRIHKGLFRPSAVSFEAVNFPDHYLTVSSSGLVRLQKRQATAEFSRLATFSIGRPKFPIW